jgi:hypothetical protein
MKHAMGTKKKQWSAIPHKTKWYTHKMALSLIHRIDVNGMSSKTLMEKREIDRPVKTANKQKETIVLVIAVSPVVKACLLFTTVA